MGVKITSAQEHGYIQMIYTKMHVAKQQQKYSCHQKLGRLQSFWWVLQDFVRSPHHANSLANQMKEIEVNLRNREGIKIYIYMNLLDFSYSTFTQMEKLISLISAGYTADSWIRDLPYISHQGRFDWYKMVQWLWCILTVNLCRD